jgi:hypothetical protein
MRPESRKPTIKPKRKPQAQPDTQLRVSLTT